MNLCLDVNPSLSIFKPLSLWQSFFLSIRISIIRLAEDILSLIICEKFQATYSFPHQVLLKGIKAWYLLHHVIDFLGSRVPEVKRVILAHRDHLDPKDLPVIQGSWVTLVNRAHRVRLEHRFVDKDLKYYWAKLIWTEWIAANCTLICNLRSVWPDWVVFDSFWWQDFYQK